MEKEEIRRSKPLTGSTCKRQRPPVTDTNSNVPRTERLPGRQELAAGQEEPPREIRSAQKHGEGFASVAGEEKLREGPAPTGTFTRPRRWIWLAFTSQHDSSHSRKKWPNQRGQIHRRNGSSSARDRRDEAVLVAAGSHRAERSAGVRALQGDRGEGFGVLPDGEVLRFLLGKLTEAVIKNTTGA